MNKFETVESAAMWLPGKIPLVARFISHLDSNLEILNSLLAVWGVCSLPGRYCATAAGANPIWSFCLESFVGEHRPPPSIAAMEIKRCAARRPSLSAPRIVLSRELLSALVAYLEERVELLEEAESCTPGRRFSKDLKSTKKLFDFIKQT